MITVPRIVIADGAVRDPDGIASHFAGRADLVYRPIATPAQLRAATMSADALVVALETLSSDHMHAISGRVRVIGRMGVGLDTLALGAARARGIAVVNEPSYGSEEVASHAVAMLLALQRRLPALDAFVRDGWEGPAPVTGMKPLDEIVAGVVGCGRIGRKVVEKLVDLVGTVVVHDPHTHAIPAGARRVDCLSTLLEDCDAVTIHAPLDASTRGRFGRRELACMRRGAILVNVSRGGQIDEAALADAMNSGHLGGAGLDVFAKEPLPPTSALLRCQNMILSPHCAGYSERSAWRLAAWTIEDVLSWLQAGAVTHGKVVVPGGYASGREALGISDESTSRKAPGCGERN